MSNSIQLKIFMSTALPSQPTCIDDFSMPV